MPRTSPVPKKSNETWKCQVLGWCSKTTECIGKPNVPEFEGLQLDAISEQKLNISVQRRNSTIRSRQENYYVTTALDDDGWGKRTSMFKEYTASRKREDSKKYASSDTDKEIGPVKNIQIATIMDVLGIKVQVSSQFTRILRMDFDKQWSRKICDWNSSSQLSHRELHFLVARERRQLEWSVSRIFLESSRLAVVNRARLTWFEQCQNSGWTFNVKPLPPRYG